MAKTLYDLPVSGEKSPISNYLDDAFAKSLEKTVYLDEENRVLFQVIGSNVWSDQPLIYLSRFTPLDRGGDAMVEQVAVKIRHLKDEEMNEFGRDFALCVVMEYSSEYGEEELTPLIADLLPLTLSQLASQLELNGEKALVRIKFVLLEAEGESQFIAMLDGIQHKRYNVVFGTGATYQIYISAELNENRS